MSIDLLHDKIRKLRNPAMVDFSVKSECIAPRLLQEEGAFVPAYERFCRELMATLKGLVPAVRFAYGDFALLGGEGLQALSRLLHLAGELGYYTVVDCPDCRSPWSAEATAKTLLGGDEFPCDGVIVSPFIGSDAVKPFVPYCKSGGKDLFVVLRSPNKSASELQDLLTGTRLVHNAAADIVNRFGESIITRCGYSPVGALVSATAPTSVRNLRAAHQAMFMIVDGLDYPSGNYKNCSHAFDRFGYGAIICAGTSITAAWMDSEDENADYLECARQAAERMKKNLQRYVVVL